MKTRNALCGLILSGLLAAMPDARASFIYDVNRIFDQSPNTGSVVGFIETDIDNGILNDVNIVDFELTLSVLPFGSVDPPLTASLDFTDPFSISGNGLIATPTGLFFDFNDFLAKAQFGTLSLVTERWFLSPVNGGEIVQIQSEFSVVSNHNGLTQIGNRRNTGTVPESGSTLAMLGMVFAGLALRRKRA